MVPWNDQWTTVFTGLDRNFGLRLLLSESLTKFGLGLIPSGLTSRILTCTELKGHCFVLVSGYVC